jgi:hypothetical protein
MTTSTVAVDSADHGQTSLKYKLGTTTATVVNSTREYLSVTGGGCLQKMEKESNSANDFAVITDNDEVISSDYSYKFVH